MRLANVGLAAALLALQGLTCARADSAPKPNPFAKYADPDGVVLAVETPFAEERGSVRLTVYDDEQSFLEEAATKHFATLDEDGVAIMRLGAIEPGEYAFVVYYDENGDGKLNRGKLLGKPKEPLAFSNGVRPKLRRPKFEEAKVDVEPGSVVVIRIEDED